MAKNFIILLIVGINFFFLLANGSKAMFAVNVSGLTYLGIILNLLTVGFFTPDLFRIFWRRRETIEG